jgi:hypothetical protein
MMYRRREPEATTRAGPEGREDGGCRGGRGEPGRAPRTKAEEVAAEFSPRPGRRGGGLWRRPSRSR